MEGLIGCVQDLEKRVKELERISRAQTHVIDTVKGWFLRSHPIPHYDAHKAEHAENLSVKHVLDNPDKYTKEALQELGMQRKPLELV